MHRFRSDTLERNRIKLALIVIALGATAAIGKTVWSGSFDADVEIARTPVGPVHVGVNGGIGANHRNQARNIVIVPLITGGCLVRKKPQRWPIFAMVRPLLWDKRPAPCKRLVTARLRRSNRASFRRTILLRCRRLHAKCAASGNCLHA